MAVKVLIQFRPGYPQAASSSAPATVWVDITDRIDFTSLQWDQQATDKNTSLRFDVFTLLPLSSTRYDQYASYSSTAAPVDPNVNVDNRVNEAVHDTTFFIDITNRTEIKLMDGATVLFGGVVSNVDTERTGASHIVQRVEALDYTALLDEIVIRDYNAPNASDALGELATSTGLTSQVITGGSALIAGPYTFRVIAVNGAGNPISIFTHITQYISPSDVTPADNTVTPLRTIQLTWSAVAGVNQYLVYAKQGIGTANLYLQSTIASGTTTYSLSTTPVNNTATSPEGIIQKGSIDVDIISGSLDSNNANYKGIFNAIDPNLNPGINNTTYVKPSKVLYNGAPDPDKSYRFSPTLETGLILRSGFGGKTIKQALKTITDKTGAIFWVDAEKNLHYSNKKAQELVQNPRFDSSSSNWTLGTNHTINPNGGPFGHGNTLLASTSSSTNETRSEPIPITADTVYMARARGWANGSFADNWDCEVRYYSDAGATTQVGSSTSLFRTVAFSGNDGNRWSKAWAIAKSGVGAVSARLVAKRKAGATAACAWTDFSLIEVTGEFGFSDRPSDVAYALPLKGFETPKAPREASGIANRLLVYGVYKDPTNVNELESVEYNAGLSLTKAQGGSLAASTYWVRVIANTPSGTVFVRYATETITDADVAAATPVRTLSANWASVPTATSYDIYVGSGRMAMRLKQAAHGSTSYSITSVASPGAQISGEPDVYYYKVYDFAPGLWESGGKIVEATLNDQLVDSEDKAQTRALSFWEEKGIAMRTWEFDHLEEPPMVGTVIPFIWEADDVAEPLIVKGVKGKFLGDRIYWTTTLGSDPSLIKKGVTQIFSDLKQATLRLNDTIPPVRPQALEVAAPSGSLIQTPDGVTRATVVANWTPSPEDDFAHYVVQYGYDSNFANTQSINVNQTTNVQSLSTGEKAKVTHSFQAEPGKRLYYRVAAKDRTGNQSDFTDSVIDLPADTTAPDAPTNVQVTASLKSMAITWAFGFYDPSLPTANTNNTDFSRFKIYRKEYNAGTNPNEPWVKIAETSANVYIDTNFVNYTNLYQYKVSTVDRTGNESTATQETSPTYRSPNKITGTVDIEDATITSAQIASLTADLITAGTLNISTGMSVISDGTATLPQFEVDKDGVTIRDDAGNIVLQVNGSNATLDADRIAVSNLVATEVTVGAGGSVVRVGNYPSVSPTFQGIWGGAANPTSAAFTLATDGAVTASNLTATGGSIGGWTVGASTISSSSGNVVLSNNGVITAGSASPSQAHMSGNGFWAGADSSGFATAPFRVSTTGGVTAKNISVIGGTVSVGDAPIAISYVARSASGLVTVKTAAAVNATVGQNITIDVTSAPWATDADFNGAFNVLSITNSSPYTITYQGAQPSSAITEVAATGFVYTGARISGESASGTWFSVDTGFALKNPANVSQNIITATASNVSINADFIKAGEVVLGNLGENAIQSTNFSVSNTGTITAQDGTVGGWTLAPTKLSSGTSTSYVALATSGGYSIYAGDDTPSEAPFSVTPEGSVYARSGTIGGWTLGQYSFFAGSGSSRAGVATSGGYAFYAGDEDPSLAEFSVTPAGALTASNITATGGTVGGWTLASSRLYASATSGATTKFYGVVADPVLLGKAFFAGATNSAGDGSVFEVLNDGSVIANNLSITGGPAAGNVINVNGGTFSVTSAGAMTATSASVTGTISTSNITATGGFIGGWTLDPTSLTNSGGASGQYAGILDTPSTGIAFFAGATNNVGASAKFSVTNDGAITATSGTIGGYTLASDRLTNASTTGSIRYAGLIDTADATGRAFFAGATDNAGTGATFSVTNAGAMTATSGSVGGWLLGATSLTAGSSSTTVGIDSGGTNPAFYAGSATPGSAPFRVTSAGALSASSVEITGGSITIGVAPSAFSVTTDGQVRGSGAYFDPIATATQFRPAIVVAGNTTEGDIAAASSGTLNLGVTTLGATGTGATGQFTNVLQMTSSLITANKTLYIGASSTSTTGLSFKQNRGHIAPFSASDANSSIGFYTSSARTTFTPLVASAFFPGGNGSSNFGYDGTNLTANDSLVVTGRVSHLGADSVSRSVPFMFYGKSASASTNVPGEGGILVTVSYTGETGATPLVVVPTIYWPGSADDKLVASVFSVSTGSASIRISNTNEGVGSDSATSRQVWLIGYTAS